MSTPFSIFHQYGSFSPFIACFEAKKRPEMPDNRVNDGSNAGRIQGK
jgi:hypothetical protein